MIAKIKDDSAVDAMRQIFSKYGERLQKRLIADYRQPEKTLHYYWAATLAELETLRVPANSKPAIVASLKDAITNDWLGPKFFQGLVAAKETVHEMAEEAEQAIKVSSAHRSGRHKDVFVDQYREAVIGLCSRGLTGEAYCREMKLPTPMQWQKKYRCPPVYIDAYNYSDKSRRKQFRRLIVNQKNKLGKSPKLGQVS